MKLGDILADLILQARTDPGPAISRQLGKGMSVIVRANSDLLLTLWVARSGVVPADREMTTTLRHAKAPADVFDPATWKRGRSTRSGQFYIQAEWQLQPELTDATPKADQLVRSEENHDGTN